MNIHTLMFGWEYPPRHLGGLGVACQGLVRGLLKLGTRVTLVLPHPGTETEGDVEVIYPTTELLRHVRVQSMLTPYESAEAYHVRMQRTANASKQIYGDDLYHAMEQFSALSVEMTKDTQPDVVHCHDWMTYEAGIRAASYHNKPLVTHIHATELDRTHFQPNSWIFERERTGFLRADRIIAVSNYTKNILTEHYGIAADKIAVVHNGNAPLQVQNNQILHSIERTKKHPLVLFLGRLALQKGPYQFLAMAKRVRAIRKDVQFVIAGEGGMLGELVDQACALGLQDCLIFTGKVSSAEARTLYEHASCFVMPSLSEPFGLVVLEAIAHGTPVVMSRQSGVSEVVSHGFVVDFWDTEKMADCVLTILREQPLAEQLRSEAPRAIRHLTWENQAQRVCAVYEHVLRHFPPHV